MEIVGTKLTVPSRSVAMNRCEEHGYSVESFCRDHHSICCKDCVSRDHSNCKSVVQLKDAVNDGDMLESVDTITKELEELMTKFDSARNSERETMRSVDSQGRELEKKVKKFRQNVDKMLDKLEVSMMMKKEEITADERSVVKKRIEVCDMAINNIKDSLQTAKGIQKDSDLERKFIAVSKMKTMNDKYQGVLEELTDGRGNFSLKFVPNRELVQELDSLGSINVKSTIKPTEIVKGLEETKLTKTRELDVTSALDSKTCTITGCTFLPDGSLVLADESNTSIKVVPDGANKVAMVKVLEYAPWDLISISGNEVALRSSFTKDKIDKTIHIFKVTEAIEETSTVSVDGRPRAIAFHNGEFYIAVTKKTDSFISILSKSGKVKKTITPKQQILYEPQYMEFLPRDNILYISDFSKGITALATNGDVIFQRLESSLTEYGGLVIDDNGDIFVCAGKPYGIYRVTPNGSGVIPFITWEDDIDPQAMTFCKRNKQFLVTCCSSQKAFVYKYITSCSGNVS